MAWSKLVDLALTEEEKLDSCMPCCSSNAPRYPYGTCISLTDKELAKLKMDLPALGDVLDARCFMVVTSVSTNDGADGETCRVELQIQRIAVENEMTESEQGGAAEESGEGGESGEPTAGRRRKLYGGK